MHRQYLHLDTEPTEGFSMAHLDQLMALNDLQLQLRDLYWADPNVDRAVTDPLWARVEELEASLGVLDVIA